MESVDFLIVGDGNAGATAAQRVREEDEDVSVGVVTDESEPLYNRIMLKNFMKGNLPKKFTRVHDEDWYEKRGIDLRLDTEVERVDVDEGYVETGSGGEIGFGKLLVATGGSPRRLPFDDGFDNVEYMWTIEDAEIIHDSAEESERAVVIGGGLLGIDLAMSYAENDVDTFYLIRGRNWWQRGLDEEGAEIIHDRLEEKGVNVMTDTEAIDFDCEGESVQSVVLDSGEVIECDSVAVAIGQEPNSGIIDVEKNDYNMIKTNEKLETSAEDVYAAGNMVEYYSPVFERRTVNGSWDHSEKMGETAAQNMAGGNEEFNYVNTYGVGHFDVQFLSIGDFEGEPVEKKYSEDEYRRLFFDGKRLVGAVMIGYTKGQEEIKDLIQEKERFDNRENLLQKSFWES